MNEIARSILALPNNGGDRRVSFKSFLEALCADQHHVKPPQLTHFSAFGLQDISFWYRYVQTMNRNALGAIVRHLNVKFEMGCGIKLRFRGARILKAFIDFLEMFPVVRFLQLYFGCHVVRNYPHEILPSPVFPNMPTWKNLHTLSLGTLITTSIALRKFLKDHSGTLRSLELSTISLETDLNIPRQSQAQWIDMLFFLNQELSLQHMKFSGYVTYGTFEAWTTFGEGSDGPGIPRWDGCLANRIEKFVSHEGPCPFTRRKSNGEPGLHFHPREFWDWEEDKSWEFDHMQLRPYDISQ